MKNIWIEITTIIGDLPVEMRKAAIFERVAWNPGMSQPLALPTHEIRKDVYLIRSVIAWEHL